MQRRRRIAAWLTALAVAAGPVVAAPGRVDAAPPGDDTVVAFLVRGAGNGHGKGLSQWGAYGRALDGQGWEEILEAYYGGTTSGTRGGDIRVRLTPWDGQSEFGVISEGGTARWNGSGTAYRSLRAIEVANNVFDVYGSSDRGCALVSAPAQNLSQGDTGAAVRQLQQVLDTLGFSPGPIDGVFGNLTRGAVEAFQADAELPVDGLWRVEDWTTAQAQIDTGGGSVSWTRVGNGVTGPITFTTDVNESTSGPVAVLGACEPDASVTHYRGSLEFRSTSDGNRVVNEVAVENYLRGVVPKEVSASWGSAGGGLGMHALRAQAVAARSFGLSQQRYSYAGTCDTSSCQVYGGAAARSSASAPNFVSIEQPNTDQAIEDTATVVREWPDGSIVETQFSASNGPRTAGGVFAPVDDPWDDVPSNPYHRWSRVIDADSLMSRYGLSNANGVRMVVDPDSTLDGIWANEVDLGNGDTVSAWSFRNAFGLRAPGFELIPIRRELTAAATFAFIGDSVGTGMALGATSELQVLTEGWFSTSMWSAVSGRRTSGGSQPDGVAVARTVPVGTDVVLVELGYNDDPAAMEARIDAMMQALTDREVGLVVWANVSTRRSSPDYAATNAALAAAVAEWDGLAVLDWNGASRSASNDRWFADGVHLTASGEAEFSMWLRERLLEILIDGYTPPSRPRTLVPGARLEVPVLGVGGVPESGVSGVALNVTAVGPSADGHLTVWPCGLDEPWTSTVNYLAGQTAPNAVVVPVDETGRVCVSTYRETDVIVDVSAWFATGSSPEPTEAIDQAVRVASERLIDTRDGGARWPAGEVLRVPVVGVAGVPESGVSGVALNVTAVDPVAAGHVTVWPCAGDEPWTSTINYVPGQTAPNAVVVPVDETGEVCITSWADSHLLVDVSAWFVADETGGVRVASDRLLDSRDAGTRLPGGEVLRVPVVGVAGVPESGVSGVALNVTAVAPSGDGHMTVWPCGEAEPWTSSVNYVADQTAPNAVIVPVDATGQVCITSWVDSHVVVDVSAWFASSDSGTGNVSVASDRLVDSRDGTGPIPPR